MWLPPNTSRQRPPPPTLKDVRCVAPVPHKLQALSGFAAGRLDLAEVTASVKAGSYSYLDHSYSYLDHFVAAGKWAVLVKDERTLGVLDASDPAALKLSHEEVLASYPEDLLVYAGQIYRSLGYNGVETRPLQ